MRKVKTTQKLCAETATFTSANSIISFSNKDSKMVHLITKFRINYTQYPAAYISAHTLSKHFKGLINTTKGKNNSLPM